MPLGSADGVRRFCHPGTQRGVPLAHHPAQHEAGHPVRVVVEGGGDLGHRLAADHDQGPVGRHPVKGLAGLAVARFVAAGLGVALIPDLILAAITNPGVAIRPVDPPSHRTVHVVTTPDLERVPAVAATLEALYESSRSLRTRDCTADTESPALLASCASVARPSATSSRTSVRSTSSRCSASGMAGDYRSNPVR